jgi:hypothetical protein
MGISSLSQVNAEAATGLTLVAVSTFSAVSSASIDGCFTSQFDVYRIVLSGYTPSASSYLNLRLRASSTDRSGSTYAFQFGSFASTTVSGARATGQTSMRVLYATTGQYSGTSMEIYSPAGTNKTQFFSMAYNEDQVPTVYGLIGGWESTTTAADGFSIIPASGTCSGTLRVYGFRNAL